MVRAVGIGRRRFDPKPVSFGADDADGWNRGDVRNPTSTASSPPGNRLPATALAGSAEHDGNGLPPFASGSLSRKSAPSSAQCPQRHSAPPYSCSQRMLLTLYSTYAAPELLAGKLMRKRDDGRRAGREARSPPSAGIECIKKQHAAIPSGRTRRALRIRGSGGLRRRSAPSGASRS